MKKDIVAYSPTPSATIRFALSKEDVR